MTQEKRHGFAQFPYSFIFAHPELEKHDLTVLLVAIGISKNREDFFKVSLRELAKFARVSPGLLCDSISAEKRDKDTCYREGILTKLQGLGCLEYMQKKPPKGQVQTYIRINFDFLWADNNAFLEAQKKGESVYAVNTKDDESVYPVNSSVDGVNTSPDQSPKSVYGVNSSVYSASTNHHPNKGDNKALEDKKITPLREQWYSHFDKWFRTLPGNPPKYKVSRNEKSNKAIDEVIASEMSVEGVQFIFLKMAKDPFWRQHLNIPKVVEKYPVWIGEFKPVQPPAEEGKSFEEQEAENRAKREDWLRRRDAQLAKG